MRCYFTDRYVLIQLLMMNELFGSEKNALIILHFFSLDQITMKTLKEFKTYDPVMRIRHV